MISWIKFEIFGRKSACAIPSLSLSTFHLPGFQIKPCHSTSLSLSQALIFNSSYVNPTFTFKTYQPLAFKFSRVTQLGFQIKLCHSTLLLLSLNSQSCLMKFYYKMRHELENTIHAKYFGVLSVFGVYLGGGWYACGEL